MNHDFQGVASKTLMTAQLKGVQEGPRVVRKDDMTKVVVVATPGILVKWGSSASDCEERPLDLLVGQRKAIELYSFNQN